MKKILFIGFILVSVLMTGCKKDNETDLTSNWTGVYVDAGTAYGTGGTNTNAAINNILISKVSASTVKIQIKAVETSYIYTLTTVQSAAINGTTTASIDEIDGIAEHIGQYHITGTLTLQGNHITFSATATNTASASAEKDVINLSFSGNRHQ